MELAVDIGNTFIKAGLFQRDRLLKTIKFKGYNYQRLLNFSVYHKAEHVIISSVRREHPFQLSRFRKQFKHVIELDHNTPLPIKNNYQTPETLGKDRVAAAVGAQTIFPESNVLVVDMGSAITIDFLNQKGEFTGGNISPGMRMRYSALHSFTNRLPLLKAEKIDNLFGQRTHQAIHCGVQNGIVFEIEKYIESVHAKYRDLKTILTGGDANFFDNKLKYTIFVELNLILTGLNRILKYNIYEL